MSCRMPLGILNEGTCKEKLSLPFQKESKIRISLGFRTNTSLTMRMLSEFDLDLDMNHYFMWFMSESPLTSDNLPPFHDVPVQTYPDFGQPSSFSRGPCLKLTCHRTIIGNLLAIP